MDYIITMLEGTAAFISPCILPLLPVYISYFAGSQIENGSKKTVINASGFVIGFTFVFVLLGALAGVAGKILNQYETVVNIIAGAVMIIFGLSYIGVIKLPFTDKFKGNAYGTRKTGFLYSVVFGMVFSVSWTPCVGAFLGSALMLAAAGGDTLKGIVLLLCFSAGLGMPFIISAILIERIRSAFDFIKKHFRIITVVSGIMLIATGLMTATGLLGYYLALI